MLVVLLLVEVLDEVIYGAREAAWPLIRNDLGLTYTQVGLLLGVPILAGVAVELAIGVAAEHGLRRQLILIGGVVFAATVLGIAAAPSFVLLLAALVLAAPASAAFVGLGQTVLMDAAPTERDRTMAGWALAGSVGVVLAPLLVAAAPRAGAGWRGVFAALGLAMLPLLVLLQRLPALASPPRPAAARASLPSTLVLLGRRDVVRWLVVLETSNLMLDVLHGFLALYLVDGAGLSIRGAVLGVGVWTIAGLVGNAVVLLVLRTMDGLRWLRASAAGALVAYPAFLIVGSAPAKFALLAVVGILSAGWYAIPKARLYDALQDRSSAVIALGALGDVAAGGVTLVIGAVAASIGISIAVWGLMLAPVGLLVGTRCTARPPHKAPPS